MKRPAIFSRPVLAALLAISSATLAAAQQHQMPQGIEALRQSASSKTEFTLDHSMLILASKLSQDNGDLRRVIAGVSGITVGAYRFPGYGAYDPEALSEVKQEYHRAGWMQLMNKHEKDGGPGATDLWVQWENNAVSQVAILLAKGSEVDFVLVSGRSARSTSLISAGISAYRGLKAA